MNQHSDRGRNGDERRSCPTRSLREYLAHRSEQVYQQNEGTVEIQVDVGDGRRQIISIGSDTDIRGEAKAFCMKYKLQPYVQELLAESMQTQYLKESQEEHNQREAELEQELKQIYSSSNAKEVLMEESPLKREAAMKNADVEEQTKTYESHKMPSSRRKIPSTAYQLSSSGLTGRRSSAHFSKDNHQLSKENKENRPIINEISQEICQKFGKTNIIQFRKQRSRERMQAIRREQTQKEAKDMEECLFRPKINPISQRVDRQLVESNKRQQKKVERYELLYEHFRQQELKKAQMKENANAEMSFQPTINVISKKIVEEKKLMGGQQQTENTHLVHAHCRQQGCSSQPKTGRNPRGRNTGGLPIGEYLYQQAGKRSSKPNIQPKNQVKALQHSDYLVSVLKQKKLKEIFVELTSPPHNILSSVDIPPPEVLEGGPYRLLLPLLEEITKLGVVLGQQDFIEAGLALIQSLTPDQRYQLISKKKRGEKEEREGQSLQSTMTRARIRLGEDLYTRGLAQNQEREQRMEKSREERVREELRGCTFRPVLRR